MQYPAMIVKETEHTGITGAVHRFDTETSRVYSTNTLFYALQGSCTCFYAGQTWAMQKGDIFFLWEGEPIQLQTDGCHLLLCSIPSATLEGKQRNIVCNSADFQDKSPFHPLVELLHEIIAAQYHSSPFSHLRLQSLWMQFLYLLLNAFYQPDASAPQQADVPSDAISKTRRRQVFSEILDTLEKNYQSSISLNDLAALYYYNPSYLSKLFVKYTGLHFSDYMTELRLKKALPLLTQTNLEIGVISDRTGFSNPRSFQKAFQKKYRLRPSRYRTDYCNAAQSQPQEDIRENIRHFMELGILPVPNSSVEIKFPQKPGTAIPPSYLYAGRFLISNAAPCDLNKKNNVLNINRARDLLLDTIQENIRTLQKEIGFEYLSCHGLLSDDMQIFFQEDSRLFPDSSIAGNIYFDFTLYEKIFRFAKETGLKFIIHLAYTPSILARESEHARAKSGSLLAMPRSMEQWNSYIAEFFTFFYQKFGDWLLGCPVVLWQVPDIEINLLGSITEEEYFELYRNTWQTIKNLFPEIKISSPTISCEQTSLSFEKNFLAYCSRNNCVPDMISLTYISNIQPLSHLHHCSLQCRNFEEETRRILHSLNLDESMPIHLPEYYYTFGYNTICDSMIGAIFPLRILLENHQHFQDMGYWTTCDFTTDTFHWHRQFSGNHGIFTHTGGRKPIYYTLLFLSRLGEECLGMGNGYIVTKKKASLQLLLFYDIPENEWPEPFTEKNALEFYRMFPEREISLDIEGFTEPSLRLKEYYLNYEIGGSYEVWFRSGGTLLTETGNPEDVFSSAPAIFVHRQNLANGILHYQQSLKPFEIRFVEICRELDIPPSPH